jgi:hypothetical protein
MHIMDRYRKNHMAIICFLDKKIIYGYVSGSKQGISVHNSPKYYLHFHLFWREGQGQKDKIVSKWRTTGNNFVSDFCNPNTSYVINITLNCKQVF